VGSIPTVITKTNQLLVHINLNEFMFTIIEIILTVFAWRNGWKWRSLFPLIIGYLTAIVLGITLALLNMSNQADIIMYGWILNSGMLLSLVMMILIPRNTK
jgi:hypothetical protein